MINLEAIKDFISPLCDICSDNTTDLVLNPNGFAYLYHSDGKIEEKQNIINPEKLKTFAFFLAGSGKEDMTDDYPGVSFRLNSPRKMRIEILISPAVENPCLCIRFYVLNNSNLEELLSKSMFTEEQYNDMIELIKTHHNILISGETGCGKTTLANALINKIDTNERVIIIEDLREIDTTLKNSTSILTTGAFDGTAAIIRSLRMRPDRIIYGEVRSSAAFDLLDAWNTGHSGGIGTIHSFSAESAKKRLAKLASRKDSNISYTVCQDLTDETIDCVIQLKNIKGKRQITEFKIYHDKRR